MSSFDSDPSRKVTQQPESSDTAAVDGQMIPESAADDSHSHAAAPAAASDSETGTIVQEQRQTTAKRVGPLATARAFLKERAKTRKQTQESKKTAQFIDETLPTATHHRRGGTETDRSPGQTQAVDTTIALVRAYQKLERQPEAAKMLRDFIYKQADTRSLNSRYGSPEARASITTEVAADKMEQASQDINNALSPVKVVALRELLVKRARDQVGEAATLLQKEMAEDSALLKLSKMGMHALTTEQLAQFIGVKPADFAEEIRMHRTPIERALLLDRLNFMIRVDATGILENRANEKTAERVPEDQASPLSLLLPEVPAERGAALDEAKKLINPYMSPPVTNRQRTETAAPYLQTDKFYDEELQKAYAALQAEGPSQLLTDTSLQELQALSIKLQDETLIREMSGAGREELRAYNELRSALDTRIYKKTIEADRDITKHREELVNSSQAAAQNTAELLDILRQARASAGNSDNTTTAEPAAESAEQPKAAEQPPYDFEATWREVPNEAPDENESEDAPAREAASDTNSVASQTNGADGEVPQADEPKRPFNTDNLLQFSAVPDDRLNDMPLERLRDLYNGVVVERADRGTTADLQGHYDQLIKRVGQVIEHKQKTSTPRPRS